MSTPVLHVIAGPNGAGKSTFYATVLEPATGLPFVNADMIAAARWPGEEMQHAYTASQAAADDRAALIKQRVSFVTETVFSHPSKLDLLTQAADAGYLTTLHVIVIPGDLAVARVDARVALGGHDVPEEKIRERAERLWAYVVAGARIADEASVYDNTAAARPYRLIARLYRGRVTTAQEWPSWTPDELRGLSDP